MIHSQEQVYAVMGETFSYQALAATANAKLNQSTADAMDKANKQVESDTKAYANSIDHWTKIVQGVGGGLSLLGGLADGAAKAGQAIKESNPKIGVKLEVAGRFLNMGSTSTIQAVGDAAKSKETSHKAQMAQDEVTPEIVTAIASSAEQATEQELKSGQAVLSALNKAINSFTQASKG